MVKILFSQLIKHLKLIIISINLGVTPKISLSVDLNTVEESFLGNPVKCSPELLSHWRTIAFIDPLKGAHKSWSGPFSLNL